MSMSTTSDAHEKPQLLQLCFYVPSSHKEAVKEAVFEAGGGRIGDYDCCCFESQGRGQFRPLAGSAPFIGAQDQISYVDEVKIELVCTAENADECVRALKKAHPYEEVAYHLIRIMS
mmetsp:Transcript_23366/g.58444  ORF Transcript_23366/g.58444 Transcript_23366/m.58444 type:complete len:117 (+) Transcript_23366:201-551(+)